MDEKKFIRYERSSNHRKSSTAWKETERRLIGRTGTNVSLEANTQSEKDGWWNILQVILTCMSYLIIQKMVQL